MRRFRSKNQNDVAGAVNASWAGLSRCTVQHLLQEIDPSNRSRPQSIFCKVPERRGILAAIIAKERDFLTRLDVLSRVFVKPLQELHEQHNEQCLVPFAALLPEVIRFVRLFLSELRLRFDQWETSPMLGDVFVKFSHLFTIYIDYTRHFHTFLVASRRASYPIALRNAVESVEHVLKSQHGASMSSFVTLPLTHMARYHRLIEGLMSFQALTDDKGNVVMEPNYQALLFAKNEIDRTCEEMEHTIQQTTGKRTVKSIEAQFAGGIKLAVPGRFFVMESAMSKINRTGRSVEYTFHLFNDVLLYSDKSGSAFKLHRQLPLKTLMVSDVVDSPTHKCCFQISSREKSFMVRACSDAQKERWTRTIRECVAEIMLTSLLLNSKGEAKPPQSFLVAPVWQPDHMCKECGACRKPFNVVRRRHHCRKCGTVVCQACSLNRRILPNLDEYRPVRLCDTCENSFVNGLDDSRWFASSSPPLSSSPLSSAPSSHLSNPSPSVSPYPSPPSSPRFADAHRSNSSPGTSQRSSVTRNLHNLSSMDSSDASPPPSLSPSPWEQQLAPISESHSRTASSTSGPHIQHLNTNPPTPSLDQRLHMANQVLTSEEVYQEQLTVLLKVWLNPLLHQLRLYSGGQRNLMHPCFLVLGVDLSKAAELANFLCLTQQLHEVSCGLVDHLRRHLTDMGSEFSLGTVYAKHTRYMDIHERYCALLPDVLEALAGSGYSVFTSLCSQEDERTLSSAVGVVGFLELPRRRLAEHVEALQSLLHVTRSSALDYGEMMEALHVLTLRHLRIKRSCFSASDEDFLRQMELKFQGKVSLVQEGRLLVREGILQKVNRKGPKPYRFHLFTDVLLYSEDSPLGLKLHRRFALDRLSVRDVPASSGKHAIELRSQRKSFVVLCSSAVQKKDWMADLKLYSRLVRSSRESLSNSLEGSRQVHAPVWMPDDSSGQCGLCKVSFSARRRRHHCRQCGALVCHKCSQHRVLLAHLHTRKKQRVCGPCLSTLTSHPLSFSPAANNHNRTSLSLSLEHEQEWSLQRIFRDAEAWQLLSEFASSKSSSLALQLAFLKFIHEHAVPPPPPPPPQFSSFTSSAAALPPPPPPPPPPPLPTFALDHDTAQLLFTNFVAPAAVRALELPNKRRALIRKQLRGEKPSLLEVERLRDEVLSEVRDALLLEFLGSTTFSIFCEQRSAETAHLLRQSVLTTRSSSLGLGSDTDSGSDLLCPPTYSSDDSIGLG